MKPSFVFLVVILLACTGVCSDDHTQKEIQALDELQGVLKAETAAEVKRERETEGVTPVPLVTTLTNADTGLYEPPAGDVDAPKYVQWVRVGQLPRYTRVEIVGFRNDMYAVKYGDRKLWVGSSDIIENQSVMGIKQRDLQKFKAEQAKYAQERIETLRKERRQEQGAKQAATEERTQSMANRFGPAVADKIMKGNLWIGMSKAMAIESVGTPDKINRTVTPARQIHEQWVYGTGMYLYFQGDTVTAFQN